MDFVSASKAQKPSQTFPSLVGLGCWNPAQFGRALPKNTLPAGFTGSQNTPHHCNPAIKANGFSAAKSKGCHRAQGNNQALKPPSDLTPVLSYPQGESTAKI